MDTENPKTAIEYIHALGRFSGKPGLHRIKALCEALGNPQDRLKFVHLAGTNGKGSTACMIASALQAAGLRTGLYTSPYLVQFYERIRVDGVMISDDDLTRLCERVTVACESLTLPEGETIGEFEFTTALAFLCFVEQECDIVVLETGLGGRCDATNVIKNAEVCVITPISLDHMAVLGNTTAVIAVKHGNPCGVGVAETVSEAYKLAYEADPVSVFGGIVVTNGTVDAATAEQMSKIFIEIIVAPKFTEEAMAILTKKKNLRLLELDTTIRTYPKGERVMRKVAGGLLVQEIDDKLLPEDGDLKVVTKAQPTEKQMEDLMLAWKIVKHAKSNGIAIAKDHQSLGIGPGQVNRIWSTQMAIERSGDKVRGAALASDAFFPFDDCVKACAEAGISCIIQPGGSVRDQDSIDACDKYGIAMVFTGMRHFKH